MQARQQSQAQVQALAAQVRHQPTPPSPLRSLEPPPGYQLDSWLADPASDTVVLCPGGRHGDPHCVSVFVSTAAPVLPENTVGVAPPVGAARTATSSTTKPPVPVFAKRMQLDAGHWITATVADGDRGLAGPLLESAVTD